MPALSLRCACGALSGEVHDASPATVNRVVCYCDDCRAAARWLGRDDLLDAHGGVDIVQARPSRVRLTDGVENLRLLQLSPKGLFRWYAGCCRTPVGNTLGRPHSPFDGIPAVALDPAPASLDAVVGPPIGGIQGRFAPGGCPPGVHPTVSPGVLAKSAAFVLTSVVARGWRGSPFFDAAGRPVATPEVLSPDARAALYAPVGA